ncbi:unnamed protein product [Acanthoscelides obtectus]|uniref:Uncharacterized protein n=1 Tax=Acanthoscelides obtectus TaxID=200917 RepID=A0A9P0PRY4_ACAOB|nr:unnamed protein product [Acanthoscelides obtectus]CAK1676400.1 hypothetical protein AOBTE_LOCUS30734 [Acanthoscelides obtectus]
MQHMQSRFPQQEQHQGPPTHAYGREAFQV